MSIQGYVNSIESFGLVDGPGVRFVVFLQGCKMRCQFCHNPETWSSGGTPYTTEELLKKSLRYKRYWGKNGGITVSGGEPLLQIDFLTAFFGNAKKNNIHTALDTSGQPFSYDENYMKKFRSLMAVTDLVILDIKEFYDDAHIRLTGCTNKNILEMARWLSDNGHKMWIRHVLVPGITDNENELKQMRKFIDGLKTVERVEVLPYHTLGIHKWEKLGIDYPLKGIPLTDENQIKKAEKLLGIIK